MRRDCRNGCKKQRGYRSYFKKNAMSVEVYKMLIEAGRGGNTHANRALAGRILEDVDSWDLVSSYIFSLLARKYPITAFNAYGRVDSVEELEALAKKYAILARIILINPRVKKHVPFPYLPISKKTSVAGSIVNDNGRVLRVEPAAKGVLASIGYTITDVDWEIIKREYDFDAIMIYDVHIAKRGYLPSGLRDTIKEYFIKKCELKEKIKAAEEWLEDLKRQHKEHTKAYKIHSEELADLKYLYGKMKNRLNGIFGMCFTDVVRQSYEVDNDGTWLDPEKKTDDFIAKELEKYNNSFNSFLVYAHGVWCTAWSRLSFEELTEACNNSKYGNKTIYGDTDSNKAIIKDETPILEFNKKVMKMCDKTGAYCVVNGHKYYLGIAEKETDKFKYKKFRTQGSKKYCYFDEEGLHVTVSGVVKEIAPKELKNVENFEKGFVFKKAGGKTLYYNDEPIHTIEVDGCKIETASNIGMIDSTYTLGLTTDYERILALYAQGF